LVEDYEKRREDERDEETGMGFGVWGLVRAGRTSRRQWPEVKLLWRSLYGIICLLRATLNHHCLDE
jgi:hypothetical protein